MDTGDVNVVFIVVDTLRWDHCYEYQRETMPFLRGFASDAVCFRNHFAAGTFTPPSHASMFTGKYVSEHGYVDSMGEIDDPLLAEVLAEHGYQTCAVVPTPNLGIREPLSRGFDDCYERFRPHPNSLLQLKNGQVPYALKKFQMYYGKHPRVFAREFAEKLGLHDRPAGEFQTRIINSYIERMANGHDPFFLFTNLTHPHSDYYTSEAACQRAPFDIFDEDEDGVKYLRELARGLELYRYMTGELDVSDAEWQALKDWYDVAIHQANLQIESVVERLKAVGEYDETMIIVTADHGEHFGERRRALHHFSVYDELMRVPMYIKLPGQRDGGETFTGLSSHVDLFETIAGCTSVDAPPTSGRNMFPLEDYNREYVFAEYPQNVSSMSAMGKYSNIEPSDPEAEELFTNFSCVRTHDTKYIRRADGREELYEYTSGSGRVATDAASVGEETYDDLRAALDDTLSDLPSLDDIAPDHPDDIVAYAQEVREVDAVEEQQLKDLGYL